MVGFVHTSTLNGIYRRVDVTTATVEVSSMHVNNEWFARDLLSKYASRVGEPIVTMDDIKLQSRSQYAGNSLVVADLLKQVVWIATGESYAAEIIGADA
jgi:hypothetical protein